VGGWREPAPGFLCCSRGAASICRVGAHGLQLGLPFGWLQGGLRDTRGGTPEASACGSLPAAKVGRTIRIRLLRSRSFADGYVEQDGIGRSGAARPVGACVLRPQRRRRAFARPQPRCGWMGCGTWTQGRPRSSANPGLGDATPLALVEGVPPQRGGRILTLPSHATGRRRPRRRSRAIPMAMRTSPPRILSQRGQCQDASATR
jgi:hypothetical protein